MPQFLVRLTHENDSVLLLWSTIVDAPVGIFDDVDDIREWTRRKFGEEGLRELPERLERLEAKGTSCINDQSAEETVSFNRAGRNETCLSIPQLVEFFGRQKGVGEPPAGRDLREVEEEEDWGDLGIGHAISTSDEEKP